MQRAFLSYCHTDEQFVDTLVPELQTHLKVWLDKISLLPGVSLLRQIAANIDAAVYVLVVLTRASVQSEWVRKEVAIADSQGARIIGLKIDDCTVPPEIRHLPYIDFAALGRVLGLERLRQMLDREVVLDGKIRLVRFEIWGDISATFIDDYTASLSTAKDAFGSGGLVLDESVPLLHQNMISVAVSGSAQSRFDGYSAVFPKMLKVQLEDRPILPEPPTRRVRDSREWVTPGDGTCFFAAPTAIVERGSVHKVEIVLGRARLVNLTLSVALLWCEA